MSTLSSKAAFVEKFCRCSELDATVETAAKLLLVTACGEDVFSANFYIEI